jgi:diketogulonate reductase-like aldo/keto reductase
MQHVMFGGSQRGWPALGLGTWRLGESEARRSAEVAALRLAIDIGYRVFDTAEMYGEGGAEQVLGEAVAGALRAGDVRREALFIVSKVYPHHASRAGVVVACDRSRRRMGLDGSTCTCCIGEDRARSPTLWPGSKHCARVARSAPGG